MTDRRTPLHARGRSPLTPWLAVASFAGVLVVNGLATGLPLFGRSTEEISARFPVFVTPAGFTFSIWGVIYLALAAFTVYQALPGRRDAPWLEPLRRLFIATCVFPRAATALRARRR